MLRAGEARCGGRGQALEALLLDPGETFLFALLDSPHAIVVSAVDAEAHLTERQRVELGEARFTLLLDPRGRFLIDLLGRQLNAWLFDRAPVAPAKVSQERWWRRGAGAIFGSAGATLGRMP